MLRNFRFVCLLALACPLGSSCGPDPEPLDCSAPHPEFHVLILAPEGPLPPDILLRVFYGGSSVEVYQADTEGEREVVFCQPSTRDGVPLPKPEDAGAEASIDASSDGTGGFGGVGGADAGDSDGGNMLDAGTEPDASVGGAGGSADGTLPALSCDLYTQGPARVEVEADGYAMVMRDLRGSARACTVSETIELELLDGGM